MATPLWLNANKQGDKRIVHLSLKGLDDRSQELIRLKFNEGLSYKEIAEVAHLAPGTVMSRLARARAKLTEYLATYVSKEK